MQQKRQIKQQLLTQWSFQWVSCLRAPSYRMDIGRIIVDPVRVIFRPAVEPNFQPTPEKSIIMINNERNVRQTREKIFVQYIRVILDVFNARYSNQLRQSFVNCLEFHSTLEAARRPLLERPGWRRDRLSGSQISLPREGFGILVICKPNRW